MLYVLCLLILIFIHRVNQKLKNPYKLIGVIGAKGSGKSLYLAELASRHKGDVFSNFGVGQPLNAEYWRYDYPDNSLLMIDEVGVLHDNRHFKSFPPDCRDFYKYQRKRKLHVVLTSQDLDFDVKIRKLMDKLYLLRRFWCFQVRTSYRHTVALKKKKEGGGSELTDTEVAAGIPVLSWLPYKVARAVDFDTTFEVEQPSKCQ